MRFFSVFALLLLQFGIFAVAQRGATRPYVNEHPDVTKNTDYRSPSENGGNGGSGVNASPAKANVPGAIAKGNDPKPAADQDNEADIEEIGEKLKDLLEKIIEAVKDAEDSSSSTITSAAVASVVPLPPAASPCSYAVDAYEVCSSANGNFSAFPKTQQAGCLCNAYNSIAFNDHMKYCYDFAHTHTQYQTYASAVAGGTALCTCDPSVTVNLPGPANANGCQASTSASATTPTSSQAPPAASPSTQPPTGATTPISTGATPPAPTGAASRLYRSGVAVALSAIATLMALR